LRFVQCEPVKQMSVCIFICPLGICITNYWLQNFFDVFGVIYCEENWFEVLAIYQLTDKLLALGCVHV